MEKSPEAFRTISEVADGLDLPQHVLRFWETRFPQIRPLKRAGGRRYYRPDDIERLRAIKRLLYDEGYTIKGVQKLFRGQGVQGVAGVAAHADMRAPVERPTAAGTSVEDQTAAGGDRMGAPAAAPGLALKADEVAMLRDVLAQIGEAQRLLAQARSQGS